LIKKKAKRGEKERGPLEIEEKNFSPLLNSGEKLLCFPD